MASFVQIGQGFALRPGNVFTSFFCPLDSRFQVDDAAEIVVFVRLPEGSVAFAGGSGVRSLCLQLSDHAICCGLIIDLCHSFLRQLFGALKVFNGAALQDAQLAISMFKRIIGGQGGQRIIGRIARINGLDGLGLLIRLLQIYFQIIQIPHLSENSI